MYQLAFREFVSYRRKLSIAVNANEAADSTLENGNKLLKIHPSGCNNTRIAFPAVTNWNGGRAIQLGLDDSLLASYAREWIVNIQDISEFVQQQHQYNTGNLAQLLTPRETVYPVTNPDIGQRLGVSIS